MKKNINKWKLELALAVCTGLVLAFGPVGATGRVAVYAEETQKVEQMLAEPGNDDEQTRETKGQESNGNGSQAAETKDSVNVTKISGENETPNADSEPAELQGETNNNVQELDPEEAGKAADSNGSITESQKTSEVSTGTVNSAAVNAVMLYVTGDSGLGEYPRGDAEAMKMTLAGLNEFKTENIQTIGIPQNSSKDYKTSLWNTIKQMEESSSANSVSVFLYSGHGGYGTDGTSFLSLGGSNNITAAELRDHLKNIKGKVVVFLDACYSGGMEMPTSDTDPFLESFIGTFYETGSEAMTIDEEENNGSSPQFYFISAASSRETALQSVTGCGGELTATLGHALGYDRNVSSYQVHAADTTSLTGEGEGTSLPGYKGDGKITMTELADYYKRVALVSTPVVYPETDNNVLFTYSTGTPATFMSWITYDTGTSSSSTSDIGYSENNVPANSNGQITVSVTVANLTEETIGIGADAYSLYNRTDMHTADSKRGTATAEWGKYISIGPNEKSAFDVVLTSETFKDVNNNQVNPFCLKVYDYGNTEGRTDESIRSYNELSFYTSASKADDRGEIKKDALRLEKPGQLTRTGTEGNLQIYKTSSSLPLEIVYDDDDANRETAAACRLYLYAYDVTLTDESKVTCSIPEGIHVDKTDAGKLLDENGNSYVLPTGENKKSIVVNRPMHGRRVIGGNENRASVYTYVMDTSELTLGHYYILEVLCKYDDGSTNKAYTIIQRTSAKEAETYQIPWYRYDSKSTLSYQTTDNVIPVGTDWENAVTSVDRTVKGASAALKQKLDNEANGQYIHTVLKWQKKVAAEGTETEWVDMKDSETFEEGGEYISEIQIKIADSYNAVFTMETSFDFYGHVIDSVTIGSDGKTANVRLKHKFPSGKHVQVDDAVSLYWADTFLTNQTEISKSTELKWGDRVVMLKDKDCNFFIEGGLKALNEKVGGNTVYVVTAYRKIGTEEKGKIEIAVWKNDVNSKNEDGTNAWSGCCCCGTMLLQWNTIHPTAEGGDDGGADGESGSAGDGQENSAQGSAGDTTSSSNENATGTPGGSSENTEGSAAIVGSVKTVEASSNAESNLQEINAALAANDVASADGTTTEMNENARLDSGTKLAARGGAVDGTGDEENLWTWLLLCVAAAAGLSVMRSRRWRR